MQRLRTFGIVAHIDAGKTTLTERILYDAGAKERAGSVDDGTASTDWLPEERSRGISIEAAATRVAWAGHELQVVDTPGHVDFVAEVERCLWVLDAVVVVVDGVRGVESQTKTVWAQAAERGLPRLLFVNKLDRVGADFGATVDALAEQFEVAVAPIVLPLHDEAGQFAGLGHALTGQVQWFAGAPSPADRQRLVVALQRGHERLLELAADAVPEVMAAVVDGRRVEPERLLAVLRDEFLAGRLAPVFAGAALLDRGVDWLLDGIVAWAPSIVERARTGMWATAGAGEPAAPFAGLVFKVDHRGEIWNFLRVARGRLRPGDLLERQRGARPVAVGAVGVVQADRRRDVQVAGPGEIVVLVGELGLRTGDVLTAPGQSVWLPPPRFPEPVLAAVVEPARADDGAQLLLALRQLAADDPTLRVDHRGGVITVRGMGELHLEIVAERLRQRVGVEFVLGRPQVDRRATIRGSGSGSAELRATIEGRERRVRCAIELERVAGDASAEVVDEVGRRDAANVRSGLAMELNYGLPQGPLVGARCRLVGLEVDGGEVAEVAALLASAAGRALAQALAMAEVVELEPVVAFEVACPESGSQPVLADLGAREAEVHSVHGGRLGARIEGTAPLRRMLGYVTKLRSMTKGLGRVSLRPSGWRPRPAPAVG